jgi:hypothetical protein
MLQGASRYSDGLWFEWLEFNSWQKQEICPYSIASRLALGPRQPPIQGGPGPLTLVVKQPGHVADHSFPSSAKAKNDGTILPLPNTPSWLCA